MKQDHIFRIYNGLFDQTVVGIAEIDTQTGRFVKVNQRYCDIVGYTLDELQHLEFQAITYPPDLQESLGYINQLHNGTLRRYHLEKRYRRKNGSLIWVGLTALPLWSEGEEPDFHLAIVEDINDRKLNDIALLEEQQRLANIIEGIRVGTWEWNVQTGETFFNEMWAGILGYTLKELSPININSWESLVHPDDLKESERLLQLHFSGELPFYECDCRMRHKNGNWIWIRDRGQVLSWSSDHKPLVMFGTHTDITDLKLAEVTRLENEANFRAFFEAINDIIVVSTPDGKIIFVNKIFETKLGYSKDEVVNMHVLDLHPADKQQEAEKILNELIRGERYFCPLPLITKAGVLVPAETRIWLGRWNGKDCMFGICRDLTPEEEAKQRFERLFRNNPALMAVSDIPERRFVDVNDAFINSLGFVKSDVIGKTSEELQLFIDSKQQGDLANKLNTEGRIVDYELKVRRKDGIILDGLFSGEIIHSQGKSYYLTLMINITERKQMERELTQYKDTLRSLIEQISVDEEQERKRIAENLHDVLGQSLVLTLMKMERLDISKLPNATQGSLEDICQTMRNLIKTTQLITYDLRNPVLHEQGLITAIEEWIHEEFTPRYKIQVILYKGLSKLDISFELELFAYRALRELLVNVGKHANVSIARVVFRFRDGMIQLSVRDSGVGFDPSIFFSRMRSKHHFGLFSIRERLDYLGGMMKIRSKQGKGTSVTLILPEIL